MESHGPRRHTLITALIVVEWTTIAAGFIASAGVVVKRSASTSKHVDDGAAVVLRAKSACGGATTTLGTLRAWLDGAELPAEPSGPEPTVDDTVRARGAALFAQHCATCHGEHGDGNGPTAAQLTHAPMNFTVGTYELRTTEHDALPTDLDLFRTITRGVHGTGMPPWFALPERDRWALVAHLKTLSKAFADDEAPPPIDISNPPAQTPERIAAGKQVFDTAGCASCHGANGRGDGPAAASLVDKTGMPEKPRDFQAGRFHRSSSVPDIYMSIVTGFDGTPMGSFAKILSTDQLWNVAMYVHSMTPPLVARPNGIRCSQSPAEPQMRPDELVGIRTLTQSLHPTN